jgi:uncharacterized protein (DUF1501 family)
MDSANRRAMTSRGFEQVARRLAFLLKSGHDIGFVDVGGWDTHVAQGGATGALASRFEELGQGLAVLADEMGETWDRTTVVVISEFGRTFRENGNRGTDHGHGSVLWVLGGGLRGGRGDQRGFRPFPSCAPALPDPVVQRGRRAGPRLSGAERQPAPGGL